MPSMTRWDKPTEGSLASKHRNWLSLLTVSSAMLNADSDQLLCWLLTVISHQY